MFCKSQPSHSLSLCILSRGTPFFAKSRGFLASFLGYASCIYWICVFLLFFVLFKFRRSAVFFPRFASLSTFLLHFALGLAYLILKYFIDKYNLYFALGRAHRVVKVNVHHTAVNFVILCAVLLQLTDLFFSLLRLRKCLCVYPRRCYCFNLLSATLSVSMNATHRQSLISFPQRSFTQNNNQHM